MLLPSIQFSPCGLSKVSSQSGICIYLWDIKTNPSTSAVGEATVECKNNSPREGMSCSSRLILGNVLKAGRACLDRAPFTLIAAKYGLKAASLPEDSKLQSPTGSESEHRP